VGLTVSEIFTPMLVKKSLNSLAISTGSVSKVPFLSIFSIEDLGLFKLAASFNNCHVRLEFFIFKSRLSA
jgi:hypothetical protein